MRYQAVIFDLDGVIVSTDAHHYQAWKQMADSLHIHFDERINKRLLGVSRMESLDIILERCDRQLTQAEKAALAEGKNNTYRELLAQMTPADLSGEVRNTLERLRANGLKLAIGSSSKNARFILERVGLSGFFDAVSDGNNITRSKPDPEVFLKAADMLGVDCGLCAVVEDARSGIIAAHRAGMTAIGIHDAADAPETDIRLGTFAALPEALGLE